MRVEFEVAIGLTASQANAEMTGPSFLTAFVSVTGLKNEIILAL